jgi:AraC-like DNA-binding protein
MEDRETILKMLNRARQLDLGGVHFAVPEKQTPAGVDYLSIPRLIVITAGSKRAWLPLSGGRTTVCLATGDLLYCLPNTWEQHDWGGHYEMLCVVPRQDYLRVSFYKHDSSTDTTRPEAVFLHTGLPYHEAMRSTVKALNSTAGLGDPDVVKSLAKALLGLAEHECRRRVDAAGGRPVLLFNRIRNWTANSFQEDISRQLVAKVFKVSPGYVSQLFKAHSDGTFQDYLTQCRMNHARELLVTTDLTIYQVADQAGFQNCVHFVRHFRELNGLPPGQYRSCHSAH